MHVVFICVELDLLLKIGASASLLIRAVLVINSTAVLSLSNQ